MNFVVINPLAHYPNDLKAVNGVALHLANNLDIETTRKQWKGSLEKWRDRMSRLELPC